MKYKRTGFTIVELLTAMAIIAMLVALLVPSVNLVRNLAKKTRQKVQLTTIDLALTAFRTDYGDYPPSSQFDGTTFDNENGEDNYCGAEKLAEALLGQDLLGFHPDSVFKNDGLDDNGITDLYPINIDPSNNNDLKNMQKRKGPYLDLATANAFKLEDLFGSGKTSPLDGRRYVICDMFGKKKIVVKQGNKRTTFKAGTPILYYRANTSSKKFGINIARPVQLIYNYNDNDDLIDLKVLPDLKKTHKLADNSGQYLYDDDYKLVDPKVSHAMGGSAKWPYRPDSYILISAGIDGEYGTNDDICNFGK